MNGVEYLEEIYQPYSFIFLFNYKARDNTNKNHNLLCSLDPPNQSWLFWLLSASITRGAYMGGYLSLAPPPPPIREIYGFQRGFMPQWVLSLTLKRKKNISVHILDSHPNNFKVYAKYTFNATPI